MFVRRVGCLGAAFVLVVLASGCTAGEDESSSGSPWESDIRALASDSTVALVQDVAQDGVIEELEYREVQDTYLTCLGDLGFAATTWVDENGKESYETNGEWTDELESALTMCGESTGLDPVENLYVQSTINPDRVDFDELIAQCLRELDVVDESYTGEQYKEDLKAERRPGTDPGAPDLLRCENDPLGAMADR